KMLDEKSQEELKKLAAQIKAKKLGAAEKALKAAEAEAAAENERGKLDATKKAEKREEGIGNREQEKPVQAPVAAPAPVAEPVPVAAPVPAASVAADKKAEGPSLIDLLGEESKAK
ncbi:MAG: hypothetical protein KBT68_03200, partial [bacterium]|nr:hypothetical protein [Candidatus Colisoma equi]